jgi:hypothetical protein
VSDSIARTPRVASDGEGYLVAWLGGPPGTDGGVWVARVARDGTVLDPDGIAVSLGDWPQYWPAVGSNGEDYLVAWQDYRTSQPSIDVFAARVRADGSVLDPGGFVTCAAPSTQQVPVVASDGDGWLVAWMDFRAGTFRDLYATRVGEDGSVADLAGSPIQTGSFHDRGPALASAECGGFLAVYERYADETGVRTPRVFARTITSDSGPSEVAGPGGAEALRVERSGGGLRLSWADGGSCVRFNVHEGRVASLPAYDHLPLACHLEGAPLGSGRVATDVVAGSGDTYYLVTASNTVAEGSSGSDSFGRERDPSRNTCGPRR